MQQARQSIAAHRVGAQPVIVRGSGGRVLAVLPAIVKARQQATCEADHGDQRRNRQGGHSCCSHEGCLRASAKRSAPEFATTVNAITNSETTISTGMSRANADCQAS